jgi:hypothetical protein
MSKELIRRLVKESLNSDTYDTYYHGSCKDFDNFKNIGNNASITIFGNELPVQGNFITKNKKFSEIFLRKNTECFIYVVNLLSNKIFDLRDPRHYDLFMSVTTEVEMQDYKKEEYIVNGLPSWDLYPVIEIAHKNGFDGIKLLEFSTEVSMDPIESVLVFNPSNLKIIDKLKY